MQQPRAFHLMQLHSSHSHHACRSLAGKPGAARKAWEALQADKLARGDTDAVPLSVDDKPSILEDDLDEIEAKIHPTDEDGDEDSSSDEIQVDDQLRGAKEEEEESQAAAAVKIHLTVEEVEALQVEAKAKGYGKLYAAMGGGEEGLEACIAVEALCEVSTLPVKMPLLSSL